MSTNKPFIKTYVEPDIKSKIKYIAESNLMELIAENYINEYEHKFGKLIIEKDGTIHPKQQREQSSISKSG
jgi:very-short-patch-repair endonuclease